MAEPKPVAICLCEAVGDAPFCDGSNKNFQEMIIQSPAGVVAIARYVKPGYEAAFEGAVRGVILAASTFPGYAGGEVLHPETKR